MPVFPQFCFRATYLNPRPGGNHRDDDDCHRDPLTIEEVNNRFAAEQSETYRWTPSSFNMVQSLNSAEFETYLTSSIFYCDHCNRYFTVGYNCRTENVEAREERDVQNGWKKLQFHNIRGVDDQCIALVGDAYGGGRLDQGGRLGTTGPDRWFDTPALLPESCQHPQHWPSDYVGDCVMAGQLSMIIALIAQKTTLIDLPTVFKQCFRPCQTWVPHNWAVPNEESKWSFRIGAH